MYALRLENECEDELTFTVYLVHDNLDGLPETMGHGTGIRDGLTCKNGLQFYDMSTFGLRHCTC